MKIFTITLCIVIGLSAVKAAPRALLLNDNEIQCKPPNGSNGGGLQSVLDELLELLPINKLLQIYITAVSSDPEVQEAMDYIQSDDFKNIILAIQEAPEFNGLMKFSCDKLYFDAYYYYNKFADLFGLPTITRPPPLLLRLTDDNVDDLDEINFHRNLIELTAIYKRKGLKGMLLDMYDELPIEQIKKMYENKLENDEYVKSAMKLLASDEFKKMVKLVESLNEFEKLLNKLRGMDIDIDAVIKIVKKFFKWD